MGTAQRHVGFFDVHVPRNIDFDKPLKFVQAYKPTDIIIGGDFLNLEFASHWNERVFKEIGFSKLRKLLENELHAGKVLLREVVSASPGASVYYLPGNHEAWLYWIALYYPSLGILPKIDVDRLSFKSDLAKMGDKCIADILKEVLETDKLNVKVLPYNEPLELGHLTYVHGDQFSTISASMKMYPNKNIVAGHHHTHQVQTLHNAGDMNRATQHTFVPCMTGLAPGYLKCKSTRWLNGFWVCDILPNGMFDGRVKKVLGGKVMAPEG